MTEHPVIRFSDEELFLYATAGAQRQAKCILKNRKPTEGVGHREDWQISIEGLLGEVALAKYLGLYHTGMIGIGASDVSGNEVRTTRKRDGELKMKDADHDDAPYWLLTGYNGTYTIRGWIYGRDAKRKEWFGVKHREEHPMYWVPQSALTSPDIKPETVSITDKPCLESETQPHNDMSEGKYDNTGRLWKNKQQREGKNDPDYKGDINLGGADYWLSGWVNEFKDGTKFIRIKTRPKTDSGSERSTDPLD
jgi:hypothetical protein